MIIGPRIPSYWPAVSPSNLQSMVQSQIRKRRRVLALLLFRVNGNNKSSTGRSLGLLKSGKHEADGGLTRNDQRLGQSQRMQQRPESGVEKIELMLTLRRPRRIGHPANASFVQPIQSDR